MVFLSRILSQVMIPLCPGCGIETTAPGFCGPCFSGLTWTMPVGCPLCGAFYDVEALAGTLCHKCDTSPPLYQRARSALLYDAHSKPLILAFKHRKGWEGLPCFGLWMSQALGDIKDSIDMMTPVPLHWTRLLRRGFNQSLLLAEELSKRTAIPLVPHLLKRHRQTASQGHKKALDRKKNIQGAISVSKKDAHTILGKTILVVDDVLVSGATVEACAQVLIAKGASRVYVATLARSQKI